MCVILWLLVSLWSDVYYWYCAVLIIVGGNHLEPFSEIVVENVLVVFEVVNFNAQLHRPFKCWCGNCGPYC